MGFSGDLFMPITKVNGNALSPLERAQQLEKEAGACGDIVEVNSLLQDARRILKNTPEEFIHRRAGYPEMLPCKE